MFRNINIEILKSLDWDQILSPYLYSFRNVSTAEEFQKLSKIYMKGFLYKQDIEISIPDNSDFLFFKSLSPQRTDYYDLYHNIIDSVSDSAVYGDYSDFEMLSDTLNPERIRANSYLRYFASMLPKERPEMRLSLAYVALHATYILDRVLNYKFKVFVSFSEMQTIDNLLVQYLNVLGIPTVSMQHGLYVEYNLIDSVNRVNYLSSPSKNLLLWGLNTANLFLKYHINKKLYLCGKINFSLSVGPNSSKLSKKDKSILVVLDQELYIDENIKMIGIALNYGERIGCKVYMRFHPQNKKKKYLEKYKGLLENVDLLPHEIILGHTSTLLFEAAAIGKKVAQYYSGADGIILNDKLLFDDVNKLEFVLSEYRQPGLSDYFIATGNDSKDRYKSALLHILYSQQPNS